ncbi:MAG: polysaccharide biosynthesis/export family protein [Phycisphaerae bacterium]|jgi:polysaccharide export outer membrane protein
MKKTDAIRLLITSLIVVGVLSGCSKDHLDPSQIGRFRPIPTVNVILDTLGVSEESASAYEGAEDPRPVDVIAYEKNYAFSSGDVMRISIFELLQEGTAYVDNFIVNESGNISIPEIGQIRVTGLTEIQLEDEIKNSLSPGILKNPSVTVSLVSSQSRVFTILGDGVANPNRYIIPRYDFRLLDAIAVAGSASQFNVSYVYVSRRLTGQEQLSGVSPEAGNNANQSMPKAKEVQLPDEVNDEQMLEIIEPAVLSGQFVITSAEMATEEELEELAAPEGMAKEKPDQQQTSELPVSDVMPQRQENDNRIEWVFKDGRWIPVRVGAGQEKPAPQGIEEKAPVRDEQVPTQPPSAEQTLPQNYGWEDIQSAGTQSRVIKIPKDKLFGGDPRYNIIIKPGDTITVQLDVVGEFYVLGNVNNQGIINLTGRPMTLKMAIAAAGGLGPLAWPKKCEVIRRIGEKKEEIVMVDLEKIANGSQPDFFIKPNDVINVGTHGVSRYLAVLRNAFRATYGFGFIYDRNFADLTAGTNKPRMITSPVDWFGF